MDAFYSSSTNSQESGRDGSGFRGTWGVSLYLCSVLVHFALAGFLFFFQSLPAQRVLPPVIQVDLVSMDLSGDFAPTPANTSDSVVVEEKVIPLPLGPETLKEPVKDQKRVKEPEPARVVLKKPDAAKDVKPVLPPKPGRKLALKKKTFKAEKVLESARKSIEKKVEKNQEGQTEATLENALSRLEKAVETQAGKRPVPGVPGVGAKGDKTEYTAMDLYNLELMYRIQQNWAFNERVAKAEKGIEARVLIKILKNGQIRDVWFETRSGNRYLDESALKAVKKSNPLPPLPKGYATYDIGLKFTPSGLK